MSRARLNCVALNAVIDQIAKDARRAAVSAPAIAMDDRSLENLEMLINRALGHLADYLRDNPTLLEKGPPL